MVKKLNTPRKKYSHDIYRKTSHSERIDIIYQSSIHKAAIKSIATAKGMSYNSVRNIIKSFQASGRTNKKKYVHIKSKRNVKADKK